MKKRCDWCTDDEIYIRYHDEEWGVPCYDDQKLFEFLILEGCQAGLSWITILKRREGYQTVYDGFDPKKMARWSDTKIEKIVQDSRIIRNRLKVAAAKKNACAYLEIVEETGSFSEYIWSFVGGKPVVNKWRTMKDVPATTPASDAMSKDLKKRGFSFVGSTICYAYMQAVGMVNDHVTSCFRYKEI